VRRDLWLEPTRHTSTPNPGLNWWSEFEVLLLKEPMSFFDRIFGKRQQPPQEQKQAASPGDREAAQAAAERKNCEANDRVAEQRVRESPPTQSSTTAFPSKGRAVYSEKAENATVLLIFDPILAAHVFVEAGVDDQLIFQLLKKLHPEYLSQRPLPEVQVWRLDKWPEAIEPFATSYLRENQNVDLAITKHKAERATAEGKMFYMVYLVRP
jgi:hypothetical protein